MNFLLAIGFFFGGYGIGDPTQEELNEWLEADDFKWSRNKKLFAAIWEFFVYVQAVIFVQGMRFVIPYEKYPI